MHKLLLFFNKPKYHERNSGRSGHEKGMRNFVRFFFFIENIIDTVAIHCYLVVTVTIGWLLAKQPIMTTNVYQHIHILSLLIWLLCTSVNS